MILLCMLTKNLWYRCLLTAIKHKASGTAGIILRPLCQNVIRPESIDYHKCITLKGAFDGNKTHTIPTAVVKLRSPRFCYDKDVEVRVGVTEMLPPKVDCLIGNGLFKLHPHLKDIIIVRECEMTEHAGTQNQIDSECSQTMQHTHIIIQ